MKCPLPEKISKIVAVGLNYTDHAGEMGMAIPAEPVVFLKAPTTIIHSGDNIVYPSQSTRVDYEAELAVVIKNKIKNISPEEARAKYF